MRLVYVPCFPRWVRFTFLSHFPAESIDPTRKDCNGPGEKNPALSTQAREDHCTVVYTTQERKFILRHGGAYEFDLGRSCISCKPVRGDSASGHSLDTWCEVGRHLPSQYPKGTVRKTLKGDAIQKARDGDHCKWHTERKIKHWKKMLRRGRFMLQKGLRKEEL